MQFLDFGRIIKRRFSEHNWDIPSTIYNYFDCTVKLVDKELLDKEQLGVKELFTDFQPFHIINLLLDKELLPILKC